MLLQGMAHACLEGYTGPKPQQKMLHGLLLHVMESSSGMDGGLVNLSAQQEDASHARWYYM